MLDRDITSANATVVMSGAFPAVFTNFSADNAWSQDSYTFLEHRMGVDGHVAVGYTPVEKEITFSFEANSPTLSVLNAMYRAMEVKKKPFYSSIVITVPSIGKVYNLIGCYLTSYKIIPDGARVLDPVDATFTYERIEEAQI